MQLSVLARSSAMDALIHAHAQYLSDDSVSGRPQLDGLIYCMGLKQDEEFVPLYIGKAETTGKCNGKPPSRLRYKYDIDK